MNGLSSGSQEETFAHWAAGTALQRGKYELNKTSNLANAGAALIPAREHSLA